MNRLFQILISFVSLFVLIGCAAHQNRIDQSTAQSPAPPAVQKQTTVGKPAPATEEPAQEAVAFKPGIKWQPSYSIKEVSVENTKNALPQMKTGADVTSKGGTVTLREAIKGLADIKGMKVSWTSDVDQNVPVYVNVKADDDFWESLNNILRQYDYFYEFKDNTILVKYKETKRFYLPMPFLSGQYKSSVGGDLLGGEEAAQGMVKGTLSLENQGNGIDIWQTIKQNLDTILNLATTEVPEAMSSPGPGGASEDAMRNLCQKKYPARPAQQALCMERARTEAGRSGAEAAAGASGSQTGQSNREGFFYTIDKPLGIITVTAPRSMLEQVENYISALKKELSRQVVIEAKILEVELSKNYQKGIDWSSLLKDSKFDFNVLFGGPGGQIYPEKGIKFISKVNLADKGFTLLLNALGEYGNVKVLSNPKLTLMNGQPSMITVGESVRYIDSVSSTVDSVTGIITYNVDTRSILSGLGFAVMAQISGDDEAVLHLTPVTSKLQEPIEYRSFGGTSNESVVGLPRVFLREMSTMARVKNGQLLIIGGLIDETTGTEKNQVPLMGDLPIIGNAFKNTREYSNKRELIILLRPEIITM